MTQLDQLQRRETLAAYLRDRREDILRDWEAAVRRLPRNRELTQACLLDAVPGMLTTIATLLEGGSIAAICDLDLGEHAIDRRRAGFDLHHVITEIMLLRDCILSRWERERRPFSVREQRLLDTALDRAVLGATEYYVATAVGILRTLDHVSAEILGATSLDDAFQRLVQSVIQQMPSADVCAVLLREDGSLRLRAVAGLEDGFGRAFTEPIGEGFADRIATERTPVFLANGDLEGTSFERHGVRAIYGVPLLHRGALVGIACMGSRRTGEFSTVDRQLLESMAARAAGAVHLQLLRDASECRAQQLAESEARLQRLLVAQQASEERARFLARAGRALASSLEYRATLGRVAAMVVPDFADVCTVDVLHEDGTLGEHVAVAHRDPAKLEIVRRIRERFGPADVLMTLLSSRATTIIREVSDQSLRRSAQNDEHLAMLRQLDPRSVIVVPLVARDRVFGVMTLVQSESGRHFEAEDVEVAEEIARMASTAIENARLHEETAHAVELRDRILALVSHDLKTPLTAIDLSGAVLQQSPQVTSDAFAVKQMDVIRRNAARMSRLIGDLLDMASLQAGRLALEPRACPVRSLIQECLESQVAVAKENGVQLVLRVSVADGVQVSCDRDRIYQVIENLVGNAIKFCAGTGVVTVSAAESGECIVVTVADTGPGIEPEHLPHVFELFWKGRDGARKGTGIGLYIARGIVEAHGGRMWVESEPGRGSVFSFTLRRVVLASGS